MKIKIIVLKLIIVTLPKLWDRYPSLLIRNYILKIFKYAILHAFNKETQNNLLYLSFIVVDVTFLVAIERENY